MIKKILNITVIANASRDEVIRLGDDSFKVKVTVPPVQGKANQRVVEIIANYFDIKKNQVDIIKGEKNKNKLIYIKL